jgi:hypothetical protein
VQFDSGGSATGWSSVTPALLPVLTSCLDDDNLSVRIVAFRATAALIRAAPMQFDDERSWKLQNPIFKALDDQSDDARILVCDLIEAYSCVRMFCFFCLFVLGLKKKKKTHIYFSIPPPILPSTIIPRTYTQGSFDRMATDLAVHLDDANPAVRAAVEKVVVTLAGHSAPAAASVKEKLGEAAKLMRNFNGVDALIAKL